MIQTKESCVVFGHAIDFDQRKDMSCVSIGGDLMVAFMRACVRALGECIMHDNVFFQW